MKRGPFYLVISHLVAALIGWMLAGRSPESESAEDFRDSGQAAGVVVSSEREEGNGRNGSFHKGSEVNRFERLWNTLPDEKLNTKDRIAVQRRLLKEWAMVDLEAAIQAMLNESWSGGLEPEYSNAKLEGPFATALGEAFKKDPQGSWELITSGQFGLGVTMLRHSWYLAMQHDPVLLAGKMTEVPGSQVTLVMKMLRDVDLSQEQVRSGVVAALLKAPQSKVTTRAIMSFLPKISIEEAGAKFKEIDDFTTREGEVALYQYADLRFFDEGNEWAQSYDEEKLAEMKEVLEVLHHESQGKFLYGLLAGGFEYEMSMGDSQRTFDLIDLMVEGEHWEQLAESQDLTIVDQGTRFSSEKWVGWAMTLPEREEVNEFFDRTVRPFIGKDSEHAWQWIGELPEGKWRDRSLAEYSSAMLGRSRDLGASRAALDLISDPVVKAEAEEKHSLYEK